MMTRWLLAVCCSGVFLAHGPAAAQEQPERVARLVRDLGHASFDAREQALAELQALGDEARSHLEGVLASADPEVRLRAKQLLRLLRTEELWQGSRVSWEAQPATALEALAALAEQTGNQLVAGDHYGVFHDGPLSVEGLPDGFWPALDALCELSGNHVRPHYDSRHAGLVVVSGQPGLLPVAYAGPVRAQINAARREFTEELNYDDLTSKVAHQFQFTLHVMWEESFRLVAYRTQPEVVAATTATGPALSAPQASSTGWNLASTGNRQVTMNVRLQPPSTSAAQLDELHLRWGLVAVGDPAVCLLDDLESREPHFQDDLEVVLESLAATEGPRYEAVVWLRRGLVAPEPPEVLFQENDFELLDEQGRPFRKSGQSGTLDGDACRLKLTFLAEAGQGRPQALRVIYPRIRSQRAAEIVFHDVPLPVQQPE